MIFEGFSALCRELIKFLFGWIDLPNMPESAQSAIDTYFGYIFDNLDFLNFFVNVSTLKTVALIAVVLFSFSHVYKIMMWVIKKIPLSID